MTDTDPMDLDALLAEAHGLRPLPSEALAARVLADARAAQPRAAPPAASRVVPAASRPRPLAWAAGLLGGWPALGGLVASAVVGVTLGAAQPSGLSAWAAPLWGDEVSVAVGLDDDPLSLLEG